MAEPINPDLMEWQRVRELGRRMHSGMRVLDPETLELVRRVATQVRIDAAEADQHLQNPDGFRRLVTEILRRIH
ncbi:MAG TPA: DUF2379 family protein [Myxococcaceae bacterium]|nr:DUF2379 family protein [Myxococcaceae bacterium]